MNVVIEKNLMVAMRDGVELATDVYRPHGDGPFPTLVERIPYNKEIYGMISGWVDVLRAAREDSRSSSRTREAGTRPYSTMAKRRDERGQQLH